MPSSDTPCRPIQLIFVGRGVAAHDPHSLVGLDVGASRQCVHAEPHRYGSVTWGAGHEAVQRQQVTHVRSAILVSAEDQHMAGFIGEQVAHHFQHGLFTRLRRDTESHGATSGSILRGQVLPGDRDRALHMAFEEPGHARRCRQGHDHTLRLFRQILEDRLGGRHALEGVDA